ncbi:NADP-dependent 3-hydroxy acid dehydrogenase YdfG [Natronorubrum sediminis]|uniref:NADP-dependent 3-hydroxy acid dehydrogenase YdfG n=1 Tax=Natronorubrum sediminis TaxID=640943 RepID=A0A1H6G180_9EURY|nr:SDR family oxidoreductase [Natronorubrum sediminis]SEH15754.1 NADP-dependent 3-hydroxy acid dehydrogenase YdfG [Natronorubrum sediminis]
MATAEDLEGADDEPAGTGEGDRESESTTTETDAPGDADDRYTRKRSVLITGCSSGIGHATAAAFLSDGWQVFATARNADDITELEEAGCTTFELDVTDPDQVSRAVERVVEVAGAIDCLVNNAGYAQMGPLEDVPTADLHRQFDVNVYGPHRLARAALPHMRAQGAGRIINVSSVIGRISVPGSGAYAGSKHALEAMSDSLRAEVDEFDIDVTVIEPGPVETNFTNRVDEELPENERTPAYETLYELYDEMQLIGGGSGGPFASEPKDVARAILESATTPEPPARYPVGPLAQYGVYARFLPDTLRDAGYRLLRKLV